MTKNLSKHLFIYLSQDTDFALSWLIQYFSGVIGWAGGWMEEIEDKVHLSPAEAAVRAELGKGKYRHKCSNIR